MKNSDAIKLFLNKEGKELQGRKRINLLILVGIFFIAILSIGFGSASLKYLKFKMDDPFIQWVDIVADQSSDASFTPLEEWLKKGNMQKQYRYEDPQPNYVLSMYFRNHKIDKDIQLEGRSITSKSAVLEKILSSDNVYKNRSLPFTDDELGIIITQDALEKAGYDKDASFVTLSMPFDEQICNEMEIQGGNKGYYGIEFPIVAIVNQLPGMYSFMFSNRFWNDMHANAATTWDITDETHNEEMILCGSDKDLNKIQSEIKGENISVLREQYNNSWKDYSCLRITINSQDDNSVLSYNKIYNSLKNKKGVYRLYNFQKETNYAESNPSYWSIQMTNLDSIRSFQTALFKNCGIKLDMASVDAKDNFRIVQNLGLVLSSCIIVLSLIFIGVFIYFLLNTHFQKIQRNIGTFKAFGVKNKQLYRIYIYLLFFMTSIAFVVAFVVSYIVSIVLGLFSKIEIGYNWIDIFVWQNGLLLVASVVVTGLVTLFVANKKLKYTPGDLIYDRLEKEI